MANLKVNCSMCLEILRRFPRQAVSVPGTFQMQCCNINAVSAYHNVLSHVMGNEDAPSPSFTFSAFLLASHGFISSVSYIIHMKVHDAFYDDMSLGKQRFRKGYPLQCHVLDYLPSSCK